MARKKNDLSAKKVDLYNELKNEAKKANRRIKNIDKKFGKSTWGVRRLESRLSSVPIDAWSKYGRIKVNKKMSIAQLEATLKATKNFLASQTSTITGIRKQIKNVKKGIRKSMSSPTVRITNDETEKLYNMLSDFNVRTFVDNMGASEFWDIYLTSKRKNLSEEDFGEQLLNYYENGNDEELKEDINKIYNKYFKK